MMAKILEGRPAKMGFRMPAEWEPHEQCWMGWPVRTPPSLPPLLLPLRSALLLRVASCYFNVLRVSTLQFGASLRPVIRVTPESDSHPESAFFGGVEKRLLVVFVGWQFRSHEFLFV